MSGYIPSGGLPPVNRRTRAPDERPREYNDPSKQHELEHFYDQSPWPTRLKTAALLIPLLAVLAGIGFIAFNIISG